MPQTPTKPRFRMITILMEIFGLSPAIATALTCLLLGLAGLAVIWFVRSAPPRVLTISTGPEGSAYQRIAEKYKTQLAEHGVELRILNSTGSQANLLAIADPASGVDLAFVQGGVTDGVKLDGLVSLGSVANQPLWLFYRADQPIARLAELERRRVCIGESGSGTRLLAGALLKANGITPENTSMLAISSEKACAQLVEGKVDAVFLMGDSVSSQLLRSLVRTSGVRLYHFTQAEAYLRRYPHLEKIVLPEGSFDFGKNLPAADTVLIGPTVQLIARKSLNASASDLIIGIAQEIHGRPGLLQARGEFPAPIEYDIKLSEDAARYYKSGKSFMSRAVGSFWLASIINRVLVVAVPLLVVLVPVIKFLPNALKLRVRLQFFHQYRRLFKVERASRQAPDPEQTRELVGELDDIERAVNELKVPPSLADQYYTLRKYIRFVKERLGRV